MVRHGEFCAEVDGLPGACLSEVLPAYELIAIAMCAMGVFVGECVHLNAHLMDAVVVFRSDPAKETTILVGVPIIVVLAIQIVVDLPTNIQPDSPERNLAAVLASEVHHTCLVCQEGKTAVGKRLLQIFAIHERIDLAGSPTQELEARTRNAVGVRGERDVFIVGNALGGQAALAVVVVEDDGVLLVLEACIVDRTIEPCGVRALGGNELRFGAYQATLRIVPTDEFIACIGHCRGSGRYTVECGDARVAHVGERAALELLIDEVVDVRITRNEPSIDDDIGNLFVRQDLVEMRGVVNTIAMRHIAVRLVGVILGVPVVEGVTRPYRVRARQEASVVIGELLNADVGARTGCIVNVIGTDGPYGVEGHVVFRHGVEVHHVAVFIVGRIGDPTVSCVVFRGCPTIENVARANERILGRNVHGLACAHHHGDGVAHTISGVTEVVILDPFAATIQIVGELEGLVPLSGEVDGVFAFIDEPEAARLVAHPGLSRDEVALADLVTIVIVGGAHPTSEGPAFLAQRQARGARRTTVSVLIAHGAERKIGVERLGARILAMRSEGAVVARQVNDRARAAPISGEGSIAQDLDRTGVIGHTGKGLATVDLHGVAPADQHVALAIRVWRSGMATMVDRLRVRNT